MSIYKPTWLYIKQHNQTGLRYFGKTVSKDPTKYKGSGKRWTNHLAVHGNDVTTTWCQLFTDKTQLVEYATKFSTENNIAKSDDWANLVPEDGIWGAGIYPGYKRTEANCLAISRGQKIENTGRKVKNLIERDLFHFGAGRSQKTQIRNALSQ